MQTLWESFFHSQNPTSSGWLQSILLLSRFHTLKKHDETKYVYLIPSSNVTWPVISWIYVDIYGIMDVSLKVWNEIVRFSKILQWADIGPRWPWSFYFVLAVHHHLLSHLIGHIWKYRKEMIVITYSPYFGMWIVTFWSMTHPRVVGQILRYWYWDFSINNWNQ